MVLDLQFRNSYLLKAHFRDKKVQAYPKFRHFPSVNSRDSARFIKKIQIFFTRKNCWKSLEKEADNQALLSRKGNQKEKDYFPLVIRYMNHTPTITIKPSINIPTLPLRLSWRITQIRNPVSGIKKIKKKIILAALISW